MVDIHCIFWNLFSNSNLILGLISFLSDEINFVYFFISSKNLLCTPRTGENKTGISTLSWIYFVVPGCTVEWIMTTSKSKIFFIHFIVISLNSFNSPGRQICRYSGFFIRLFSE